MEQKKIIWLSANKFGYEMLKEAINLGIKVDAIITLKENTKTIMYDGIDNKKWQDFGIKVHYIERINNEIELLKEISPDIIMMCGWRQIIDKEVIDLPRNGMIGFHPTLLPKGRGPAPLINSIMNGFKESGITMFYVSEGIDTGDIVGQEPFIIEENDHVSDVYEKSTNAARMLIRKYMPMLVNVNGDVGNNFNNNNNNNNNAPRIKQDESKATIFEKRSLKDNKIDLETENIDEIYKKIRALSKPYKGAYIEKDGKKLIIWNAELVEDKISNCINSMTKNKVSDKMIYENNMNKKRKICVLTGTRAEFGVMRPTIKMIQDDPNLELSLIATGMHLSEEFGMSINEIKKEGFEITETVEMDPKEDSNLSMAKGVGQGTIKIAEALDRIKPDIFLIVGDRTEALAGAIAAAYMNVIIAHVSGGDISRAGLDESVRHAITKLSHIHFPTNAESGKRLIKLGEDEWRIHLAGAPCLDVILKQDFYDKKEIEEKFKLDLEKPYFVVLQHSITTEPEKAEEQITETLEAIKELETQTVVIYPNSDSGGRKIIQKIKEYEQLPFVKAYVNLPQKEYYSLLRNTSALIGNSSSGVIESASFNLPVVNIGIRQEDRARSNNVVDCRHNKEEIINCIKKVMSDEFKETLKDCKSVYGEGNTAKKIVDIISRVELNKNLLQKKNAY